MTFLSVLPLVIKLLVVGTLIFVFIMRSYQRVEDNLTAKLEQTDDPDVAARDVDEALAEVKHEQELLNRPRTPW